MIRPNRNSHLGLDERAHSQDFTQEGSRENSKVLKPFTVPKINRFSLEKVTVYYFEVFQCKAVEGRGSQATQYRKGIWAQLMSLREMHTDFPLQLK